MRFQSFFSGLILVSLTAAAIAQQTLEPPTPTAVAPTAVAPTAVPVMPAQGELQLSVVIVDELTPKPVPLTYFKVTNTSDNTSELVKTDALGRVDLHLTPGT